MHCDWLEKVTGHQAMIPRLRETFCYRKLSQDTSDNFSDIEAMDLYYVYIRFYSSTLIAISLTLLSTGTNNNLAKV